MATGEQTYVRRTGTGSLPGGRRLTWTCADGSRGRRWRSITTYPDGRLVNALLLETGPDGRLARVEISAPTGLLTLHPDVSDGTLHGNIVRADGVEHVTLPWSARHILVLEGSPVTAVVAASALAPRIAAGEGAGVPAVAVTDLLGVRVATWHAAHTGERRWRLLDAAGGPVLTVELDDDGIPSNLDDARTWPMEQGTARAPVR